MALLTTGGPFSILLLANATSATMTNVADVAAICEVVTHIILPDLIWQRDMKFAAQFLVSICKLVTPQLIMGPEIPCAPASLEEALSLPKNAISTIKIRKGRSLRLTGCQAEMQFKYFTNFTDGKKNFYPPVRQPVAKCVTNSANERMSTSMFTNEAVSIKERIMTSGKNGFFLISNVPETLTVESPSSLVYSGIRELGPVTNR